MTKRRKEQTSASAARPQRSKPRRSRKTADAGGGEQQVTLLARQLDDAQAQQAATAEVLRIISTSPTDLQRVFDTIAESAARLCNVRFCFLFRFDGEFIHFAAAHGYAPETIEAVRTSWPMAPGRETAVARSILSGAIEEIPDVRVDPDYAHTHWAELINFHSIVAVPMVKGDRAVGAIAIARFEKGHFPEWQITLLRVFADQAAIAIENVRLFDEIQDKSRKLAEASEHKSQFLANMSHELRTPLNAVLGYTELILDNIYGVTPEKMREALARIERNAKHLLGLINDVLDLSKIEAGQLTLSVADYSIGDLMHAVHAAMAPLAVQKKLRFEVEVPPDLPTGRGDEHRLRQVLLNLVGNAIKFTDSGEVLIKAAAEDASFTVAVHDTGPGISLADQSKLFQQFQQADNSITRKKGGTGLGLAISKRIIELHKGKIWVDSRVGHGSTFFFTIPIVG
jgi:signal transduction histidine kinase